MTVSKSPTSWRRKIGWKSRHLVVLAAAVLGTYAFLESRAEWSEMHRWNRAFGDMSVMLVAFSMAIGPLVRLAPAFRAAIPWRRESGIYGVLLAIAHTVVIIAGWVEWDLVRIFGYVVNPATNLYVMVEQGFGLANVIGIVALLYGVLLAFTSNDWSQRRLGGSVWKFLQQGTYVLWMVIVIHTAYFLYIHFQHFHRQLPEPNWAQLPFAGLVLFVVLLQLAASLKTWKARQDTAKKSKMTAHTAEAMESSEV